jgi:ribosomal protein L29
MVEKKDVNERKLVDLKIELLKNTTKRKSIKREIARLLTMINGKNKLAEGNK